MWPWTRFDSHYCSVPHKFEILLYSFTWFKRYKDVILLGNCKVVSGYRPYVKVEFFLWKLFNSVIPQEVSLKRNPTTVTKHVKFHVIIFNQTFLILNLKIFMTWWNNQKHFVLNLPVKLTVCLKVGWFRN